MDDVDFELIAKKMAEAVNRASDSFKKLSEAMSQMMPQKEIEEEKKSKHLLGSNNHNVSETKVRKQMADKSRRINMEFAKRGRGKKTR